MQHAHAVQNLESFLRPGSHILDVGSGSGYLVALFHHMVSDATTSGKVVGIEHIPQLVEWSAANLRKDGLGGAVDDGKILIVAGDGRKGAHALPVISFDVLIRETRVPAGG